MGFGLLWAAALDFGLQAAVGAYSIAEKTERYFDLTGSLTFVLLALATYRQGFSNVRKLISTAGLSVARLYLAAFLFHRVSKEGHDGRFDSIRGNPMRFAFVWFVQGIWVLVVSLPTLLTNLSKRTVPMGPAGYAAAGLFLLGLVFEAGADLQKMAFKANPENEGKFIQSGFWGLSRHPNYFGEIMMTTSLYLLSLPVLRGWGHLAILSPIFTTYLLLFVSGVPASEKHHQQKYGDQPAFQQYERDTALLIPYIY